MNMGNITGKCMRYMYMYTYAYTYIYTSCTLDVPINSIDMMNRHARSLLAPILRTMLDCKRDPYVYCYGSLNKRNIDSNSYWGQTLTPPQPWIQGSRIRGLGVQALGFRGSGFLGV